MNRREFLGQLTIAMSIAGITHTIPAAALEFVPEAQPTDEEIRLPSRIKGLALFQGFLIIVTDDGVFLAPAQGVKHARFIDDSLLVRLSPEVQETFYIEHLGPMPRRLEGVAMEDLRIARRWTGGDYQLWSKLEEPKW
jgi:hypothetical protein